MLQLVKYDHRAQLDTRIRKLAKAFAVRCEEPPSDEGFETLKGIIFPIRILVCVQGSEIFGCEPDQTGPVATTSPPSMLLEAPILSTWSPSLGTQVPIIRIQGTYLAPLAAFVLHQLFEIVI
jgi:hypothetical protein